MKSQEDQFSDEIQEMLRDVAAGDAPPDGAKARLLERVEASLSAPPPTSDGASATAASFKTINSWAAITFAAVGVVAIVVASEPEEEPPPPQRSAQTVPQTQAAPPAPPTLASIKTTVVKAAQPDIQTEQATEPKPDDTIDNVASNAPPLVVPPVEGKSGADVDHDRATRTNHGKQKAEESGPRTNLRAEEALLEQARAAIKSGNVSRAWKHLRRHRKQFPKGVLVEEREGLWVRGLLRSGKKKSAAKRAKRFLKRFPRSSQRRMVEEALID